MTETVLKDYFDSKVTVDFLVLDLKGSLVQRGPQTSSVYIKRIDDAGSHEITRQNLLKLCKDALSGHLMPMDLNILAFGLIGSDYFNWDNETEDGEIIAKTLFDWDNPEINFELTFENLLLWQDYLETGNYKLGKSPE
jgi:hypothetical protein